MIRDVIDEQAAEALVAEFTIMHPRYTSFCELMRGLLQRLCEGEAIKVT
jgi:hypothetical protein